MRLSKRCGNTGIGQVTFRPLECAALLRTSKRAEYSEIFSLQTCGWLRDRAVLLAGKAAWVNAHPVNDAVGRCRVYRAREQRILKHLNFSVSRLWILTDHSSHRNRSISFAL
jgi:hypothetical protein